MAAFRDYITARTNDIGELFRSMVQGTFYAAFSIFVPNAVDFLKREVALNSIDPEKFQTDEMKKAVKKLKEDWKHSPETPSDIAQQLIDIVVGKASKVQLEQLTNMKISSDMKTTNALFSQIAIITDVSLLSEILAIIGSFVPTTNLQVIGQELRSYLDYSGLSQIVGYGYGMILSNVISQPLQNEIFKQTTPIPVDLFSLIKLKWRGQIDNADYIAGMSTLGYNADVRGKLETANQYIPSVQDAIRMSVREAFYDDYAKTYGLDQEYPNKLTEISGMNGLDPQYAKYYWRAHWELPSLGQGYEMLHRKTITETQLDDLFKAHDIIPYWREPLKAISYNPITRVDVRRMYAAGHLSYDEMVAAYEDGGYDISNATKLAEWTVDYIMPAEKKLTQTHILTAYRDKISTRVQCLAQLGGLRYTTEQAELIVSLAEHKEMVALTKFELATLENEYLNGVISKNDYTTKLDKLGLGEARKKNVISIVERKLRASIKLPSVSVLQAWFADGIIDEAVFKSKMLAHGYLLEDVQRFVAQSKPS